MAKTEDDKSAPLRPVPRLPKGFRDIGAAELREQQAMLATIRDAPAIEYTDVLGKFLPDQDRPNEGVFSFQDEDEQWLSLRYDLTAPLARFVAENFDKLPKPFRRYATGSVYRNEKPGPGRFRQFTQFDADTVGAESIAADAEMCMLAADTLEALGIARGDYVIKVNNRKVLDGVLELAGIDVASPDDAARRLTVLRAMDKFDKFGADGVALLLGKGRKDESGDFTPGANLVGDAISKITGFLSAAQGDRDSAISRVLPTIAGNERAAGGMEELRQMSDMVRAAGYGPPSFAASNITPARSSKPNLPSKSKTTTARSSASARSAAVDAMTISSPALPARRSPRRASPSASQGCRRPSHLSAKNPRLGSVPSSCWSWIRARSPLTRKSHRHCAQPAFEPKCTSARPA